MHAQVWTLFHVTNQQSSRDQVVATTTTTTKSYDQRLCYLAETFISFNHSCLFLVHTRLIWLAPDDIMMWFKISGRGKDALRFYQNRSHHCQEEDEMARADMLAFLLSGWQENGQWSSQALEDIQNSLLFQLVVWVIIITDWLYKKQTFRSKTKKKPQQQSLVRTIHATQRVLISHLS